VNFTVKEMHNQPLVPILMGSRADLAHAQAIADALGKLGVACELRVASAHKTPAHLPALLAAKILSLAVPSVAAGRREARADG
jgi:phosphoribosylcarboxyaminoimidazole (NCAIR) mutase